MNDKLLTLRTIYEKGNLSQRELSTELDVSLGKMNSLIKELCIDNLYNRDEEKITDKGLKTLESFKVDNAVILACGMGIRLAPLTYEMPKSFLKINGQPMIERQIEQLKEVGINDITIMVGYLKEKFDYLIDKYDVKLVFNEEYQDKNTLATLIHAKEYIKNKNTYICVSDVYMKDNIFHKYEFEPYYSAAFLKDVKNEWQFITNSRQEILDIMEGGENAYCMMGPAFFTKEFSNKFLDLAEKYYELPQTDNFYWEDVLVRNFDILPKMYAYKQKIDSMYEFDSLKDLKSFDEEYNETGSETLKYISSVFKCKESDIIDLECINTGMTNKSYKFKINSDKHTYICRMPGEGTEKFINRKDEKKIYDLLKNTGLIENLVDFNDETGFKISEYFENSKTVDINSENDLLKAMSIYKQFHNMKLKVNNTANIVEKINDYLKVIKDNNIMIMYSDFDESLSHMNEIVKYINKFKRTEVLTHGDANPQNIIITKKGTKLIDFEYAGMADPLSDIALFSVFVDFDINKSLELFDMYLNSEGSNDLILNNVNVDEAKTLIIAYMALGAMYDSIWAMCRSALSNADYGYFNMKMYRYFKNCYKYLKENNIL